MPARKPQSLHTRHATKAEKAARVAQEDALRPERGLPMAAPARLKGHGLASEAWRRLMRLYGELESDIVTRLDQDLLIDYCILVEQVAEIDRMRRETYKLWLELGVKRADAKEKAALAAEAAELAVRNGEDGLPQAAEAERWEDRAITLASQCLDAFESVIKLDGRADRKRDLLYKLRQGLYMTPRARAGTAPAKKEDEQPLDEMDKLLIDNVNKYVNGAGDGE